jgi:hypothetical protein
METPAYKMLATGRRKSSPLRHTASLHRKQNFLWKVFVGYLIIGGMLGTITWASYILPLTWASSSYVPRMNFIERSFALVFVQPMAIVSGMAKTVLWGPSVIIWSWDDELNYSFGKWLAPGLYMEANDEDGTRRQRQDGSSEN